MDDEFVWTWRHWIALIVSGALWIALFYGIGSLLYFLFTLK